MGILNIPVTKGKATLAIDTDSIPEAVYAYALAEGLKVIMNKGMSKVTKVTYPVEDELKAAAMAVAEKNVEAIKNGTIKIPGAKSATKASGAVMTEARRLAKNIVKDQMKEAGLKISHYPAKEITAAANELLAADPSIIETAAANLEARAAMPVKAEGILATLKADPKLVAAAEAKKSKSTLSKTQAGKVAPRAKGAKGKPAQATA